MSAAFLFSVFFVGLVRAFWCTSPQGRYIFSIFLLSKIGNFALISCVPFAEGWALDVDLGWSIVLHRFPSSRDPTVGCLPLETCEVLRKHHIWVPSFCLLVVCFCKLVFSFQPGFACCVLFGAYRVRLSSSVPFCPSFPRVYPSVSGRTEIKISELNWIKNKSNPRGTVPHCQGWDFV